MARKYMARKSINDLVRQGRALYAEAYRRGDRARMKRIEKLTNRYIQNTVRYLAKRNSYLRSHGKPRLFTSDAHLGTIKVNNRTRYGLNRG